MAEGYLTLIIAAPIAAILGSFISAFSWRYPRGQNWVTPPSCCPKCKISLKIMDLFPLLSWLWQGGKCRHCSTAISWRYPVIELSSIILTLTPIWLYGLTPTAILLVALGLLLLTMSVIDLEHYILPDSLNLLMALMGIAWVWLSGVMWHDAALGFATGLMLGLIIKYGFLWLRKKDGLGMGDVKFLAAAGIWIIPEQFPILLFGAGVFGVLLGLIWQQINGKGLFPFGPCLALSFWLILLLDIRLHP